MRLDDVVKALKRGAALAVLSMGCGGGGLRLAPYPPEQNRCEEQAVANPFAQPDAAVATVTTCTTTDCFSPMRDQCPTGLAAVPEARSVLGPFGQPDGGTEACCYIVMRTNPATSFGRPLLDMTGAACTASLVTRSDWS
jgi:hypothetical protein